MSRTEQLEPEAPARVISGNFVNDRLLSPRAGAKKGWRNMSPLETSYLKGHLEGPEPDQQARKAKSWDRFEAGKRYALIYSKAQPCSSDSTQAGGSGRGGDGFTPADARIDAGNALTALERRLGHKDRQIIHYVCGLEHTPAQAVSMVLGKDWSNSTLPRWREALDGLIEALK